jgi:hypothetical protein
MHLSSGSSPSLVTSVLPEPQDTLSERAALRREEDLMPPQLLHVGPCLHEAEARGLVSRTRADVEQVPRHDGLADTRSRSVVADAQAFLLDHEQEACYVLQGHVVAPCGDAEGASRAEKLSRRALAVLGLIIELEGRLVATT